MMDCKCGRPASYEQECRDCYEDRLRHESRDAHDRDMLCVVERMIQKHRCQVRLPKNYGVAKCSTQLA